MKQHRCVGGPAPRRRLAGTGGGGDETGKKEYATGQEYLAAKKFAPVKLTTAKKTSTLEFVDLF